MKTNCKYATRCGGCTGIDKPIEEELLSKTNEIKDLFADFKDTVVNDCVGEYYPLKYRNKVHLAFGELKGKTIIGFFEEHSTKITDVDSCILFGDWVTVLISTLREFVSRFKIRPYNRFGEGIIRYAHARHIDGRLQLTMVVTTDNFAGRDWLYHKLTTQFKSVSLYLNINHRTDRAVFDKRFKFVKGVKYLEFNTCGVQVSLSPNSFLQVNTKIAEKMYKSALKQLEITPKTTVVDLYSGIGITTVMFAKECKEVISIEEVESAVENAKFMAKLNNIKNTIHLCGKCENQISKIRPAEDLVVFVDPARLGMDKAVISALIKLNPRKIVYMSCNPETAVRDVKYLTANSNYKLTEVSPYNMFPYTKHIELLACLQKQE